MIKKILMFSIMTGFIFCGIEEDFKNAIESQNADELRKILSENKIHDFITKEKIQMALEKIADMGNVELFSLLAPYVSRKVHRKAFLILSQKTSVKDMDYAKNSFIDDIHFVSEKK